MDIPEAHAKSRPHVGDPITYQGRAVGSVVRVEGSLCWCDYDGGDPMPFIWRFKDGLNNMHDWPGKNKSLECRKVGTP